MDPRFLIFTKVDHSKKEVQIHNRSSFNRILRNSKAYNILDHLYYRKLFLENYSLALCEYTDFAPDFLDTDCIKDLKRNFNIKKVKFYTIIANLKELVSFPDWLEIIPVNSYAFHYFQALGWEKTFNPKTHNASKLIEKPLSFVTRKPRLGRLYMTALIDLDENLFHRGSTVINKKNFSSLKRTFNESEEVWDIIKKGYSKLPHNNIPEEDLPSASPRNSWEEQHTSYPNFYNKSFCHFIFETLSNYGLSSDPIMSKGLFFTEKTSKVFLNRKPFIIYANPGFYKLLHSEGFKTFGEFWDESFDSDFNFESRTKKYLKVIEKIKSMSIDECRQMHVEMEEILEHNFQNMLHLMNSKDEYGL